MKKSRKATLCLVDGCASLTSKSLCDKHWFKMSPRLRQRWWRDTDYSQKPPSAEMRGEVNAALTGTPAGVS